MADLAAAQENLAAAQADLAAAQGLMAELAGAGAGQMWDQLDSDNEDGDDFHGDDGV